LEEMDHPIGFTFLREARASQKSETQDRHGHPRKDSCAHLNCSSKIHGTQKWSPGRGV